MSALPGERGPAPTLEPEDLGIGRLFHAIRDAVVVTDEEGRIVLWNPGAEHMFGWTREEAEGENVSILIPDRYLAQHHAGMARYAATGHGPLIDSHAAVELPALRKDGTEIVVELTLNAMDERGRRYALALLRDVTERVRLRETLERRSAELERANRDLSRANDSLTAFTYVVSHDLKEPVRAIDTYLRFLREDHGDTLPEEGLDMLDRALVSTERLAALLRGLLDLSRVDREHLEVQPVHVRDVLESDPCRAAYEGLMRERAARVTADPDTPAVLAAPSVFCQVLSNLVTNAIRHNPAPAPEVRVWGQRSEGGFVEIRVEDNGPGFPAQLVERFNATSAAPRDTLRSGFGLLIARRAVERLGGRIWLDRSEKLGGASVRFTIPAA